MALAMTEIGGFIVKLADFESAKNVDYEEEEEKENSD